MAALGNVLEWYDFAVYGALAATIGLVFFPDSADGGSLLQRGSLVPLLFAPERRYTAFSFSYSPGGSLLGGTAPALAAWMLAARGWSVGPLLYALVWALPVMGPLAAAQRGGGTGSREAAA